MPTPDDLVERHGDPITIMRVVNVDVTVDGSQNVEREYTQTQGVISQPSDDDVTRLEGRIDDGMRRITVFTDADVQVERQGGRDRIALGHIDPETATDVDAYTVVEVQDDTHNLAGVTKKTVMCERYSGRDTLDEDATRWWDVYSDDTLTVSGGETYTVTDDERYSAVTVTDAGSTLNVEGTIDTG